MTATPIPLFDDFDDPTQPKPPGRTRPRRPAQNRADGAAGAAGADPDQLLTVGEAAAILGIGRSTLYELMTRGAITSVKVGRCRRFRRSDVNRFIRDLRLG
jgi:excisionase family DNA binding protein